MVILEIGMRSRPELEELQMENTNKIKELNLSLYLLFISL